MERQQDYIKRPGRKKKPKATEKQLLFAQAKVETGNRKKALAIAGYCEDAKPEQNKAVQYYIEEYKKKMEEKFIDRAEEMAENMYQLAMKSGSDNVRYLATKDWLDRAGLAPVSKSEIETTKIISAENRVSRDLIDRLNNLKESKKAGE